LVLELSLELLKVDSDYTPDMDSGDLAGIDHLADAVFVQPEVSSALAAGYPSAS